MIYDYRKDIEGILSHTNNDKQSLIASAYAMHAITNIILQSVKSNNQTTNTNTDTKINSEQSQQIINNVGKTDAQTISNNKDSNDTDEANNTKVINPTTSIDTAKDLYDKHLSQNLKKILKANKLSSNAFSNLVGLPYNFINRIVKNNVKMEGLKKNRYNYNRHAKDINELVNILQFDPQWLLFGKGTAPKDLTTRIQKLQNRDEPANVIDKYHININDLPTVESKEDLCRVVRQYLKLTQAQFGHLLGVSSANLSKIETHRIQINSVAFNNFKQLTELTDQDIQTKIITPSKQNDEPTNSETTNFVPLTINGETSNEVLLNYFLDKPLRINEYLVRHRLIGIQLINQKADVACTLNEDDNTANNLVTGDRAIAQIKSPSMASIEKVIKKDRAALDIQTTTAKVEPDPANSHSYVLEQTATTLTRLLKLNKSFHNYLIKPSVIKKFNIKPLSTVEFAWYPNDHNIVVRKAYKKSASKR